MGCCVYQEITPTINYRSSCHRPHRVIEDLQEIAVNKESMDPKDHGVPLVSPVNPVYPPPKHHKEPLDPPEVRVVPVKQDRLDQRVPRDPRDNREQL